MKILRSPFLYLALILIGHKAFSQDPDFHIYICFGQSNMEGYARLDSQDTIVDPRFKVLQAVDCDNLARNKGNWYTAVSPLSRCNTGLTPADYFGRTMVANLPRNIKVGIINVAVGGCKIELFDKNNYKTYTASAPSWMINTLRQYGGNPYGYMLELAKLAQKDGVIKGILLHQGESNTGDTSWPLKVKGVYENILSDLNLKAEAVPLLAGEVVNADTKGVCASMNAIIANLPQAVPTAHVISSANCEDSPDNLHFNLAGYKELGSRYAIQMLALLGYPAPAK
jgi:hypothetical protein